MSSSVALSDLTLNQARALYTEVRRIKARNWLRSYNPYPKQREFHDLGVSAAERLFLAGNQLGKTLAGGAEIAIHLTGLYPDWWSGLRFDEPPLIWASGVTGESTRDNPQRVLVGPPAREEEWDTGTIPGDLIHHTDRSMGSAGSLDNVQVRHVAGVSQCSFKSYERGREKWQGATVHLVWFDEEPPADIYSEGLTRTQAHGIHTMITATPLLGMSEVIRRFLGDAGAST